MYKELVNQGARCRIAKFKSYLQWNCMLYDLFPHYLIKTSWLTLTTLSTFIVINTMIFLQNIKRLNCNNVLRMPSREAMFEERVWSGGHMLVAGGYILHCQRPEPGSFQPSNQQATFTDQDLRLHQATLYCQCLHWGS